LRHGVAVLAVAATLLLTLLFRPWLEHNDFLLFFPALVVSAWYGGIGPGLSATLLSLLAIDFFVLPPVYGLNLSWDYIPRLGAFAFVALLTSWLTAARKRAETALRAAHDDLERRVEERTAELSRANAILEEQIAERERAEEALRESEELHRVTLSRISDAVFITEEGGGFTYICPNAEVIFGYSAEEVQALGNIKTLIGSGFFDHRQLETAGEIQNIEREVKDKAGSRHSILVNVKRVSIKGGSLLYTCRDITGRKQAEGKIQRLLDEVWELYQLSRAIIATPDPETAISSLAKQVVEVFGANYCAIFAPYGNEARKWERLSVAGAGETGSFTPSPLAIKEVFETGEIKSLLSTTEENETISYLPLKIGAKLVGVMALVAEGLERETQEAIAGLLALAFERANFLREVSRAEALKQSDALKSALIASVSHDLRTPLTSIRASVDSLLHHELNWDQATMREFHVIISEEINRLMRLVENLLAMARIDAGELHPSPQWGSVAEICNNVLDRCAGALHRHRVRVDCAEDLPLVKLDSRLIAQALANLVENAAKYSPAGGEIIMRARLEGNQLSMSVTDEGPGIAPEDAEHIFDKFYRGARRPEQQSGGTGMGLAIARGIIEAHGGGIRVERAPGRGATFTFALGVETKERSVYNR
jgi:two-component system sensor histidine kinase KdpD